MREESGNNLCIHTRLACGNSRLGIMIKRNSSETVAWATIVAQAINIPVICQIKSWCVSYGNIAGV